MVLPLRSRHFTLVEMIAVIAIMVLVIGVTSVTLRDGTQGALRRSLKEFELFCAKVRGQVLSDGMERKVVFDPETGSIGVRLLAADAGGGTVRADDLGNADAPAVILEVVEPEDEERLAEADTFRQVWHFPETLKLEFRMDALNGLAGGEVLELWRCRRDGTMQLNQPLILYAGEKAWSFTVSEFSGQVVCVDRDISLDETVPENVLTVYR